ncbi:hypothetical protein C8A05DRAFT_37569 [Staphylotrichum tortipilum]|uniref:DUF7598 domain-containing protein n=1 Tax=Staphylotrichum tortipilum TaxID=2831512 RepID=A0AAN6RQK8_9PEZI|nr:hypothetical protein C8A05DRAFT_37569 [Staphylotrichum longicolle]
MFSLGQDSKLLGAGHVILNVLRAFNIVGLIAVMLSSMAMPILSITKGNFFFFDMITHFFVFFFAGFLLVSELPMPWKFIKGWYERCWPVLGPDHSLAWLGWGMVFIGFQPLGDYWKPGYSVDIIGLPWWRAILAASILCVTFGFFNIVASVVFRIPASKTENGLKVTVRQIRSHGTLAIQYATKKSLDMNESLISHLSPPHRDNFSARSWNKEAEVEPSSAVKRMTRVLNPRNFRKSRIQISKPIPQNRDIEHGGFSSQGQSRHSEDDVLQRPPSAMHPSRTGYSGDSRYSAAHMDHF